MEEMIEELFTRAEEIALLSDPEMEVDYIFTLIEELEEV